MNQVSYIIRGVLLLGVVFVSVILIRVIASIDSVIAEDSVPLEFLAAKEQSSGTVIINSDGKRLFNQKCASCHSLFKTVVGPRLNDIIDNDQWTDRKKLSAWIRNPAAFMKNDPYTQRLKAAYGTMMLGFPDITDGEIDAIVEYIRQARKPQPIP